MGKLLLTCEKPDAAKNIAEILGVPTKRIDGDTYFENNEYIITWALGHLINWKEPDKINPDWKVWTLKDLPLRFDFSKDLTISPNKSKLVATYRKLINRSDVSMVINAGDADREGLLIQEELYAFCGCKKPIKILWSQSLTEKEIIKCMNNLKDRNDFLPLLEAAKARATIDNMLGKTETRGLALTCFKGQHISYGRCQTPLLKLLADREIEIKNFKVSDYYEIEASFDKGYSGVLYDKDKKENIRFDSKNDAENIINSLGKSGKVIEYNKVKKSEGVNKLYSLTSLQKDMGSKYHFNAQKTLDIAQSLYEKKLTSYPRTDTEYINDEVYESIEERVKSAKNLINVAGKLDKTKLKVVCKPNKVTGHHALLPTEVVCSKETYEKLTKDEKIVYVSICKKLLSVMLPDYEYYSISVLTEVDDKLFKSTGTETISLGWKELYKAEKTEKDNDKEEEKEIPELKIGDTYNISNKKILSKQTKAPARYTTASIIGLMEKWMIGRPATMASIIQRLIDMEFIELNKSKYSVTNKGLAFIDLVLDELKDPNLTKNIEEKLQKIADNEYSREKLVNDVLENQKERIKIYVKMANDMGISEGSVSPLSKTNFKCPLCGNDIISYRYSYNCSDKNCGFKVNKSMANKDIPEKAFEDLFNKGRTGMIKNFTNKKGEKYNARLVIDKEKKGVRMEYK